MQPQESPTGVSKQVQYGWTFRVDPEVLNKEPEESNWIRLWNQNKVTKITIQEIHHHIQQEFYTIKG